MRTWIVRISKVVIGVLVLAVGGGVWYLHDRAEGELEALHGHIASGMREHGQAFRADQARLSQHATLLPRSGSRDAGPFLNPWMPWDGDLQAVNPALALKDGLREQLAGWKDAWPEHAADVDLAALDFAWMKALSGFDYWELSKRSPIEELDRIEPHTLPMPKFAHLVGWAKLRMLKGLRDGDPAAAGAELRELARLTLSTETLLGAVVAGPILRAERRAYEHAVATGVAVAEWAPFALADTDALTRSTMAYAAYAQLFAEPTAVGDVFTAPDARVGRCAALSEGLWVAEAMRPLLAGSYAAAYAQLDAVAGASRGECRLSVWNRLRNQEPGDLGGAAPLLCAGGDCPAASFARVFYWMPGVKLALASAVLGVSAPDWFRGYAAQTP